MQGKQNPPGSLVTWCQARSWAVQADRGKLLAGGTSAVSDQREKPSKTPQAPGTLTCPFYLHFLTPDILPYTPRANHHQNHQQEEQAAYQRQTIQRGLEEDEVSLSSISVPFRTLLIWKNIHSCSKVVSQSNFTDHMQKWPEHVWCNLLWSLMFLQQRHLVVILSSMQTLFKWMLLKKILA